MARAFRVSCCVVLSLIIGTEATQVTPMQKVVELLKSLSEKVAAEGKTEAAEYDKYACFCKEQADEKLYSIETSDAKIADLKAAITALETAIAELNSEISGLADKITKLEKEIAHKTKVRGESHTEYLAKAKDLNEAVDACAAAIEALKNSKKSMKGAKLDLAQVQKVTGDLIGSLPARLAAAPGAVALLSELHGAEPVPKFEYQSNDIIATLEDLLAQFKSMKKDLDVEEFDINSNFESDTLGLSNEKKFAKKEKGEKEALVADKTDELHTSTSDRDTEQKDRNADDAFMQELTNECEKKAALFDQRSQSRAAELTALAEAAAELEKGAVPNFSVNKKLVGVEVKALVRKAAVALSFMQTDSVAQDQSRKEAAMQHVIEFLHKAASGSGSTMLTGIASRVVMAEDHFVKVRALIKDIITKLEASASAEADQKSTCDKGMTKGIANRDEAKAKIENANAEVTVLTAKKSSLEDTIQELHEKVAKAQKMLLEATELRQADKAENEKSMQMSGEAIAAVNSALTLLQEFYHNAALTQTGKYVPPNADRAGSTVGDLAPKVFGSEYHGSQSESKGIIGILEVILSDFERTEKQTEDNEKLSEEDYEILEKDTKADIEKKTGEIEKKGAELADTESDLVDQQQNLSDAKDLHETSIASLEALKAMCVDGEEDWAERKQKRAEEIEALKQALEILENWQA